jgi:hypothetical protein
MSQNSDIQRNIQIKGVIPPQKPFPKGFFEALEDLRQFLRKFPGLVEEVKKHREEHSQQGGNYSNNRN